MTSALTRQAATKRWAATTWLIICIVVLQMFGTCRMTLVVEKRRYILTSLGQFKRWTLNARWTDGLKKVAGAEWMQKAEDRVMWRSLVEIIVQQWTAIGQVDDWMQSDNKLGFWLIDPKEKVLKGKQPIKFKHFWFWTELKFGCIPKPTHALTTQTLLAYELRRVVNTFF